jgi:hypothetical protein
MEVRSFMFSAQLPKLSYRSTKGVADLNLNMRVDTREYFRFTDFWTTLYLRRCTNVIKKDSLSEVRDSLFESSNIYFEDIVVRGQM